MSTSELNELESSSYSSIENGEKSEQEEPEKPVNEWFDILGSGGIMKKTTVQGKSDSRPQRLDKCTINYICMLEDETIVETQENFELQLGECDVVQGLDVAISLMDVGEKCILKIEPRLAFGSKGLPPQIPPNSLVIYHIELVSAEPEDELASLSVDQRKIMGNKKRERGNWWYCRNENNLAIQCYRRALDYLDEVEGGIKYGVEAKISDSDLQKLLEDRISVYNNMAAAQIKLELYDAALTSLQTVLRCQPNNVKALFRKAKVHSAQNEMQAALKCLEKAKEISPDDAEIIKMMNVVNRNILKQKCSDRELAKRMLNGPQKKGAKKDGKKRKFGLWLATIGAVVVGALGVAVYHLS